MDQLSNAFRALGDPTRLRILRLLAEAPLNVSELVSLLGVSQPGVSHHLAKLRSQSLVQEERRAGFNYYALSLPRQDPRWPLVQVAIDEGDNGSGDLQRLRDLIQAREHRHALNERLLEPGQSWFVWSRAVALLLPALDVADFGCGAGAVSLSLATSARSVVGIDHNTSLLAQARTQAKSENLGHVRFIEGDLHALELADDSFDLVVISQSLHHVEHPAQVLREAHRLLRPGQRLLVLELLPHREKWVRTRLGHRRLGFTPAALEKLVGEAGFRDIQLDTPAHDAGSPFHVFILTGVA